MWLDWMLAPADVPPTTAPRWWAATMASPTGVPQMIELQLELVAAGHEDAGRLLEPLDQVGVVRPPRGSRAAPRRPRRRPRRGTARRRRRRSRGRGEEAVGITAMRASRPPLAATNSLRMRRLRSLSSAPPMIMSGPGMTVTLGRSGWDARGPRAARVVTREDHRRDAARQGRAGRADRLRAAARRAGARGRRGGRAWLAGRGRRARPGAGLGRRAHPADLGGASPRAPAGTSTPTSRTRSTPPAPRPPSTWSASRRRHPDAARRRPQPDDGLAGRAPRRRRGRRRGRQRAGAGLPDQSRSRSSRYDGDWTDLDEASAPLVAFHVGARLIRAQRSGAHRVAPCTATGGQTGGAGVTMPASRSAASISSREMPSRYMIASR